MFKLREDLKKLVSENKSDYDESLALSYMGNNELILKQLIKVYLESHHDLPNKMQVALDEKNCLDLYAIIHNIKGTSLNIGSNYLYLFSMYLCEELYETNKFKDYLDDEIKLFISFYQIILNKLESEIK